MSLIPRRGKVTVGDGLRNYILERSGSLWHLGHSCPRSPVAAPAQLSSSEAEELWKMWDASCWLAWCVVLAHMAWGHWELAALHGIIWTSVTPAPGVGGC